MLSLTADFICGAVSGRMEGCRGDLNVCAVCTDTRKITPGCLYVALRGERFDGHDFIGAAFQNGASAAISQREIANPGGPVILVKDTGKALLDLAAAYRRLFRMPVVGITGSVGKTSTKEMVFAVLSQKFKTHKNEGNLNNQIGMPMSVFGLDSGDEAAVFEMGMSAFGEIGNLSRVAAPKIGIITNIGISHIEKLGSRQNILAAKLELLKGMESGSTLVLNGDDGMLRGVRGTLPVRTVTYGIRENDSDITASGIEIEPDGTRFTIHGKETETEAWIPAVGEHHVMNALAGFAAGILLGIPARDAVRGLSRFSEPGMRQKIVRRGGMAFIEDCYNASPDSMNAAFGVMKAVASGRKIAVLADMLELGKHSKNAHREVGAAAAGAGIDILFAYGSDAAYFCEGFCGKNPENFAACRFFSDKDALAKELAATVKEGDTVLFKGSRAMKLEEVIEKTFRLIG